MLYVSEGLTLFLMKQFTRKTFIPTHYSLILHLQMKPVHPWIYFHAFQNTLLSVEMSLAEKKGDLALTIIHKYPGDIVTVFVLANLSTSILVIIHMTQ